MSPPPLETSQSLKISSKALQDGFLKAFSSQLPLHQFLTEQNVDPSSIQAILCSPSQQVSTDVIQLLPSLCVIVTSSAGTDHIDLVECSHHGIQVVSVPGDQAKDVADMAGGCWLMYCGKFLLLIDMLGNGVFLCPRIFLLVPRNILRVIRQFGFERIRQFGFERIRQCCSKKL